MSNTLYEWFVLKNIFGFIKYCDTFCYFTLDMSNVVSRLICRRNWIWVHFFHSIIYIYYIFSEFSLEFPDRVAALSRTNTHLETFRLFQLWSEVDSSNFSQIMIVGSVNWICGAGPNIDDIWGLIMSQISNNDSFGCRHQTLLVRMIYSLTFLCQPETPSSNLSQSNYRS